AEMKAKQAIGTIKPRDRSDMSAIAPITFGKIAPPIMAMTRKEDSFFDRSPRPKMPSAKMVGNMIDIKKYVPRKQNADSQPNFKKIRRQSSVLMAPYSPRSLWAENCFRSAVPMNRPPRKRRSPIDTRLEAPLLLTPITPVV